LLPNQPGPAPGPPDTQHKTAARALGRELEVSLVVVTAAGDDRLSTDRMRRVVRNVAVRKAAREKGSRQASSHPNVHSGVMAAQKSGSGDRWKSIRVGGKAAKKR
jgi:hypothetical protein